MKSPALISRDIFIRILPSILVNLIFIVQAVTFDWQLGTMIWIYWLQGMVIILMGTLKNKYDIGWVFLLSLMVLYGIFLLSLTFSSDSFTYIKNGVEVSGREFSVLSNTQWGLVAVNIAALSLGYMYELVAKKRKDNYSGLQAVKRLIPLHITIILASLTSWSVLIFLVLRSVLDVTAETVAYILKSRLQKKSTLG